MSMMFRWACALLVALFATALVLDSADARNRTGSKRVGGYSSHGKGSHYKGGR